MATKIPYRNEEGTLVTDDEDGHIYVRQGLEYGFTESEIVEINNLRMSEMKYGRHICTEDALSFARAILNRFKK